MPAPIVEVCGLAWRVRRPLSLEIADMRGAKPEEGSRAVNFSSRLDEEAPPCGVDGGLVSGWRAWRLAFTMETGLGPEGSGLTVDVGARRIVVWRTTLRA